MDDGLDTSLRRCTFRIHAGRNTGTGFFFAPERALTCAHVVEEAYDDGTDVTVRHRGATFSARISAFARKPYPDLALLEVDTRSHPDLADVPFMRLDPELQVWDKLIAYGYPEESAGGETATIQYEGQSWLDSEQQARPFLKFKDGQIIPGMSGAPLLNARTRGVCGIVKTTRDELSSLGGGAIPVSVAIELFHLPAGTRATDPPPRPAPVPRIDVREYPAGENEHRPNRLFARADLVASALRVLKRRGRVLLYGMPGSGKTAVAAVVGDRLIADRQSSTHGKPTCAWLEVGNQGAPAALDALLRRFGREREADAIRRLPATDRPAAIRDLLARSRAAVVVFDDVWNGAVLAEILKAIPANLPTLATSWKRLGLNDAFLVGELSLEGAVDLLAHHSEKKEHRNDPAAHDLCAFLGCHAMSIEIAGRYLWFYSERTPGELRRDYASQPDEIPMPGEWARPGRESVRRLLHRSFQALPRADAREAFLAFGAFPTTGASQELLALYLRFDRPRVSRAIDDLVMLNLVRRAPETGYCTMHGLTHSYVRARFAAAGTAMPEALTSVRELLTRHRQDHRLLDLELTNILAVVDASRSDDPGAFVSAVENLARGHLDGRYPLRFLPLLDVAISVARSTGADRREQLHYLLAKRGNAHDAHGELGEAQSRYCEALGVAPSPARQLVMTALIGKEIARQGRRDEAVTYFQAAHEMADRAGDRAGKAFIYEQQSHAAAEAGDFRSARDHAARGVDASRDAADPMRESFSLCNLGSADFHLGIQAALRAHRAAYDIAIEHHDPIVETLSQHALGVDNHALENYEAAQRHLREALEGYRKLGYVKSEHDLELMMRQFGYLR